MADSAAKLRVRLTSEGMIELTLSEQRVTLTLKIEDAHALAHVLHDRVDQYEAFMVRMTPIGEA